MMKRLAIVSLAAVLALTAGCGGTIRTFAPLQLTVPWEGFQRVEVRIPNGRIEIRSGGTEAVSIAGEKSVHGVTQAEAEQNLEQVEVYAGAGEQSGTLLIELRYPDELRSKSPAAKVRVQVPSPCAAKVQGSNGSITVAGMEGEVSLHTSNGSIHATDIKGPLSAATSNGRIEVVTVVGDVSARTSNGSIEAREVTGACTLTTSNGGIQLAATPPAGEKLVLTTTNGAIRATLPEDLAAELKLKTSNGRVRVSLGKAQMSDVEMSRNRYRAVVNGGGGSVVAETSNGSITIESR